MAAGYFDEIIVREDENNRGRPRGQHGRADRRGHRVGRRRRRTRQPSTTILDELEATRAALDRAGEGDVVVVCVDHANQVWKELQRRQHGAASETDGLRAVVGILDADDEVDIEL